MPDPVRLRLPVPAPWQPAVELAIEDLCSELAAPREAVAPTRVDETAWNAPRTGSIEEGLEIVLMARGLSYHYRAVLADPKKPRVYAVEK